MPKVILFVPCEKFSADRFTGQIHLFGIQDIIHPLAADEYSIGESFDETEYKYIYPALSVATEWAKESHDAETVKIQQNVWLVSPDNKEIMITKEMTLEMRDQRHRSFQGTSRIAARMVGEYILQLRCQINDGEVETLFTFPILFAGEKPEDV